MSVSRAWKLWACRYESGKLWHIGERGWVKLHYLPDPIVPVLVEEILGDLYADEVTHYGWQDKEGSHDDKPSMIQVRTGNDPKDPKRALMFLDMCFPYGVAAAVTRGDGKIVALHITERQEDV